MIKTRFYDTENQGQFFDRLYERHHFLEYKENIASFPREANKNGDMIIYHVLNSTVFTYRNSPNRTATIIGMSDNKINQAKSFLEKVTGDNLTEVHVLTGKK